MTFPSKKNLQGKVDGTGNYFRYKMGQDKTNIYLVNRSVR